MRAAPSDVVDFVWDVFEHGGDIRETADGSWEITGIPEIPACLAVRLDSPLYADFLLAAAQKEKQLNLLADDLHQKLYGTTWFPETMRSQLYRQYHEIQAGRRIRNLRPLSPRQRILRA